MSCELTNGFFFFCFDGQVSNSMTPVLQLLLLKDGPVTIRMKMTDGVLQYNGCVTTPEAAVAANLDLNNSGTPIVRVLEWQYLPNESSAVNGQKTKPFFRIVRFEVVQPLAAIVEDHPHVFNGDPESVRTFITNLGLTASGMTTRINRDYSKRPRLINNPNAIPDLTPPSILSHKSPGKPFAGTTATRNTIAWKHNKKHANSVVHVQQPHDSQTNEPRTTPFVMLSPYVNKFRICGVCQTKESVREIAHAARGVLNVFSFILCDEHGKSLKVTAWNELALETDPMVIEGHTYYISGNGSCLRKKNKYNHTDLDYELVLGHNTEIYVCADKTIPMPAFRINRIPIASLIPCETPVDVIGVIDRVNDITTVISKTKGELKKREIEVVDDSNAKINLTLWEDKAEGWMAQQGEVLCIKNVLIREFMGGLSLSLASSSQVELNPDLPETQDLFTWYSESRPNGMHIASMSTQNSGSNSVDEIRTLAWAENHPIIDDYPNGVNFTARVHIDEVRRENIIYQACTTCNKKVTQVDVGWHCQACSATTADSEPRYMMNLKISDYTGAVYTTVFGQTAADLLGISAADLKRMMEENLEASNQIFKEIQFSNVFIRLKVKNEYYNDQKRRKFTVVAFKNVHPEVFNAGLDDVLHALENL